jgi:hypothetical protein
MANQVLPGPRCGIHVEKGVVGWPCRLDAQHDGPHCAVESPVSERERSTWEMERSALPLSPMSSLRGDETTGRVVLPSTMFMTEEERIATLVRMLGREPSKLPDQVKSWMCELIMATSLAGLYGVARNAFEAGAPSVEITPEFLDRLVPPILRARLGLTKGSPT